MSTPLASWTGRDDGPGAEHARWHNIVQPLAPGRAPGTMLLGFASDEGVRRNLGRLGAAEGPTAFRSALAGLAVHAPTPIYDAGDVRVDGEHLEDGQQRLGRTIAYGMQQGHFPLVLGGGHEIAWASYLGINEGLGVDRSRTLGVINLDAHFDLRESAVPTSGTGFAQIAESEIAAGRAFHYSVIGINELGNTGKLFARAADLGVEYLTDDECRLDRLDSVLEFVARRMSEVDDVYLTIDLDVLPAAVAPGVSAPAALGVAPEVVQAVIDLIARSGKLVLADFAELNPLFDIDNRTARIGARFASRIHSERIVSS